MLRCPTEDRVLGAHWTEDNNWTVRGRRKLPKPERTLTIDLADNKMAVLVVLEDNDR